MRLARPERELSHRVEHSSNLRRIPYSENTPSGLLVSATETM
jgi:hypothetical protein